MKEITLVSHAVLCKRSNGPTNLQKRALCTHRPRRALTPHSHRDYVVEVVNALTEQSTGCSRGRYVFIRCQQTILAVTIPLCAAKFPGFLLANTPVLRNIFPAICVGNLCREAAAAQCGFLP